MLTIRSSDASNPVHMNVLTKDSYQQASHTLFNLMDGKDFDTSGLSADEQQKYDFAETLFLVFRSNLLIEGFTVANEFDSFNSNFYFMEAFDIQTRTVTLSYLDFNINGGIFKTTSPLNLLA